MLVSSIILQYSITHKSGKVAGLPGKEAAPSPAEPSQPAQPSQPSQPASAPAPPVAGTLNALGFRV